jgi:dsRNA-specific ribonuclease
MFANFQTGREGGFLRIKGLTVEAILGGVFLQHGSPAAQRVYHAHILPALERQLRDPALIEAARVACDAARDVGVVSK